MNYSLKEVGKEDLYDYMYVNTYSWNETYQGIINDDFLKKIIEEIDINAQRLIDKFDQESPSHKKYILRVDNEPVGIFSIQESSDDNYPESGELKSIYLLNKAKNQGYGKLMFERAKEELKKLKFKDMIISCIRENPTNQFYIHMGGKLVNTKKSNIGETDITENIYYFENI